MTVLNQLSLSENTSSEDVKAALEAKLLAALPQGSFSVILRSYQGDFRARTTNQVRYTAMIMVDDQGRKAALARKQELESMGFRVSARGDISAN